MAALQGIENGVHDLSHIVTADAIRVVCFADSHVWTTHV